MTAPHETLGAVDDTVNLNDAVESQYAWEDPAAIREHEPVSADDERRRCDRKKADILGALVYHVLFADESGFEHCEASAHPHDQHTAENDEKGVYDEGGETRRCLLCNCRSGQSHRQHRDSDYFLIHLELSVLILLVCISMNYWANLCPPRGKM